MNIAWEKCKQHVSKLSSNYEDVIRVNNSKVRRNERDKGSIIDISFSPFEGFEIEMQVIYHNDKGIIKACYYAYNNQQNTAYVRDLLRVPFNAITSSTTRV